MGNGSGDCQCALADGGMGPNMRDTLVTQSRVKSPYEFYELKEEDRAILWRGHEIIYERPRLLFDPVHSNKPPPTSTCTTVDRTVWLPIISSMNEMEQQHILMSRG